MQQFCLDDIQIPKSVLENIRIKFFEHDSDDSEVWRDYGKFSEVDVHHQYAISFR